MAGALLSACIDEASEKTRSQVQPLSRRTYLHQNDTGQEHVAPCGQGQEIEENAQGMVDQQGLLVHVVCQVHGQRVAHLKKEKPCRRRGGW